MGAARIEDCRERAIVSVEAPIVEDIAVGTPLLETAAIKLI